MQKTVPILILCVLLLPVAVYADKQDISDMDGTDWTEWQSFQKYSFISGFMAGADNVVTNNIQTQDSKYDSDMASKVFYSYIVLDDKKPKNSFSRKEVALLLGNQTEGLNIGLYRYAILGITNGQLVEGLNTFYGDFKNKQIKLRDAVYVVKQQIKGASPEEVEAILRFLRADRDYKNLFYTDKDGKKTLAIFP
ncbi:hypothetical protein EPN27_03965 [Patescibacteria group bacterium]|nr:MAG: hypothetical protein EPN27_03965 [Patescibacteria group bacterium]